MLNMASPTPVLDMISTDPSMMLGISMCHLRELVGKKLQIKWQSGKVMNCCSP
jgi:hypothetical protein